MKTKRRSLFVLLAVLAALVLGAFATACGNTVTLSFDAGEGSAVEAVEAEKGSSVELPTPEWEGYVFDGWYAEQDFSGRALGTTVTAPDRDTTYYAKWEKGYRLTLDTDGGTLSGGTEFLLKAGTALSGVLEGLAPAKDGLAFGAWFNGDEELASGAQMPEADLMLKARYKVGYTIETYLQNGTLDGYERAGDPVAASDYVGTTVSPAAPAVKGFALTENENELHEKELSAVQAENVLRFYYDREEYRVLYYANLPDGVPAEGTTEEATAYFEETISVAENGFSAVGYRFAGWSSTRTGNVEYQPNASLEVTGTLSLYAVWDVGNTDLWGGIDYIYHLRTGGIILERDGEEYEGTIDENGVFTVAGMQGMIFEGGKFAYYRDDFAATFYALDGYYHPTSSADPIDRSETLTLDGYFHATWSYTDDGQPATLEGIYAYDSERKTYYFEAGDSVFDFRVGNYGDTAVFGFAGEEEGTYDQFIPSSETGGYIGDYTVLLDGYGTAAVGFYTGEIDEGAYYIESTGLMLAGTELCYYHVFTAKFGELVFHNYPLANDEVALVLEDEFAGEYTGEIDGTETTLSLNGFGLLLGATLNGEEYSYFTTTSEVFGTIVHIVNADLTVRLVGEDGFEVLDESFSEMVYLRTDGSQFRLYYPLILFYEEDLRAEIYAPAGMGSADDGDEETQAEEAEPEIVHVATASCKAETTLPGYAYYTLTITDTYNDETLVFPGLEGECTSVSIVMNTRTLIIEVYYILAYNGKPCYDVYRAKEGGGEFWAGIPTGISRLGDFYFDGTGAVLEGSIEETYTQIRASELVTVEFVYSRDETAPKMYFAFDTEAHTYVPIESEPYYALRVDEYGTVKQPAGIYFDGMGNAYYYATGVDYYEDECVSGPILETGETTVLGAPIYAIDCEEQIKYVLYMNENGTYYAYICYEDAKTYKSEGKGTLVLDGFCYYGEYTTADGQVFSGEYHLLSGEDSTIPDGYTCCYVMQVASGVFYRFYIKEDGSFDTVLSPLGNSDEGVMIVMDDSYNMIGMLMLGFENMAISVMYMDTSTGAMGMAIAALPFTLNEKGELSVELSMMTEDEETWMETFVLGDLEDGTCVRYNAELSGLYTDGAARLTLDGYGFATYVSRYGFCYDGPYVSFDDKHLALESDEGVLNFRIDSEEKTFEEIDCSDSAAEYVSEDGSSIEFAAGSYFFVDGVATGFWYAENGTIFFMVYDEVDAGGYVHYQFTAGGSFEYGDKTYSPKA